ncbi:hypothetical protein BFG05_04280 [Campylobacter pinnipediorum subsp. pinnipediorum]|nr:hypothetical protein BFG05_04280 [Campylobacter pinnipediorum subsp. pinnipediorum]
MLLTPKNEFFMQNFKKEYDLPTGKLDNDANLFSLFCIIGITLELDSNLYKASKKTYRKC